MRKLITKSTIVCLLLTVAIQLTSCNTSETEQKKEEVIAEVIAPITAESTEIIYRKPVVFIAGIDKGDDLYYAKARTYFQEKEFEIIEEKYSLEEIISWLNKNESEYPFGEVHIVNKGNPYKGLQLETVINGEKITSETLRKNITQGNLPRLKKVVAKDSKIIFHTHGLASNNELIQTIKDAFATEVVTNVIASHYFTIFGSKFSKHYLAKPYYVFYPTANSPGKIDLSKEIARKYPEEKDIDWYNALNNEEERYIGEAYTTQFSIPVKYEFDYFNSDDAMPNFKNKEEVMDWLEQNEVIYHEFKKIGIPLEKFRWNWSAKNNKLTIKGKTTGLCVLQPLTKPYGDLEHIKPDTNNKRLYVLR